MRRENTDTELARLRVALVREWLANHYEHCGELRPICFEGDCRWPLPDVLTELGMPEVERLIRECGGLR